MFGLILVLTAVSGYLSFLSYYFLSQILVLKLKITCNLGLCLRLAWYLFQEEVLTLVLILLLDESWTHVIIILCVAVAYARNYCVGDLCIREDVIVFVCLWCHRIVDAAAARCVVCAEAQKLVLSPGGTQIKTVHSGSIFTCTVTDYQQPADWTTGPTIRWLGPGLTPITATRGRSTARFSFLIFSCLSQ